MARRRQLSPFNLAFLDIMFCGFGAVVLLVLLVNARSVRSRNRLHEDLRAEVQRLTREVKAGTEYLDSLKVGLRQSVRQMTPLEKRMRDIRLEKDRLGRELAGDDARSRAMRQQIDKLAAALKKAETKAKKRVAAPVPDRLKVRRPAGTHPG